MSVSLLDLGLVPNNPDAGSTNTAALNRAVAGRQGTTISVPSGLEFYFAGPLNLDNSRNIRLQGEGGPNGGALVGANLTFTGAGPGPFISARSSDGFGLANLTLRYINPAFQGDLIDLSGIANDTAYARLEDLELKGDGATGARSLIQLSQAICCRILGCVFMGAEVGILGKLSNGYSNAHTIDCCTFQKLGVSGIKNAGQSWRIVGCTFEPLEPGHRAGGAYTEDLEAGGPVVFDGCWMGDGVLGVPWIVYTGRSLRVRDCFMGSCGDNVELIRIGGSSTMGSVTLDGNLFALETTSVAVRTVGTAAIISLLSLNNDLEGGVGRYLDMQANPNLLRQLVLGEQAGD